uniref:Uncharacterized protein n=1 Tax=Arundo donax TaxID=35708 RepID=A0A0A8ZKX7_ARUDO
MFMICVLVRGQYCIGLLVWCLHPPWLVGGWWLCDAFLLGTDFVGPFLLLPCYLHIYRHNDLLSIQPLYALP